MKPIRRSAAAAATIGGATAGLLAGSGILARGGQRLDHIYRPPEHGGGALPRRFRRTGTSTPTASRSSRAAPAALYQGNVLVSNFNDPANVQGTGTTIVQVTPGGKVSQFAQIAATWAAPAPAASA